MDARRDAGHAEAAATSIMARYMPKVGTRGLDMMFRTATVQANLDFASEARHGRQAARRPGAAAGDHRAVRQFAVHRRQAQRALSRRARRSGAIPTPPAPACSPFAFEPGMGFERYVDYALDVPLYFLKRGAIYQRRRGRELSRPARRPARRKRRASARRSPTGRTTCRRSFPRCGSSAISKCAAPTSGRPSASSRSRR